LTLGQNGVVYYDGDKEWAHAAYDVNAVDTTAAGDTFTGFFIAGLARGDLAPQILESASKASAIAVSKSGAAASIPTIDKVAKCDLSPRQV
jgi:ribokinase